MNPYHKYGADREPSYHDFSTDPDAFVSRRPQWKDCKAYGEGTGFEIRPTPKGLLISFNYDHLIEPSESVTLSVTSPIPWVGKSFSVSAECAHRFVLVSMRHALREFVPDQPVACTLFSDAACCECRAPKALRHLPKEWPTVMVGCALDIEVRNVSDQPSHFRATFDAERLDLADLSRHPCL